MDEMDGMDEGDLKSGLARVGWAVASGRRAATCCHGCAQFTKDREQRSED